MFVSICLLAQKTPALQIQAILLEEPGDLASDIPDKLATYVIFYRTRLRSRYCTARVMARGIFEGAEVVRGPDWKWGNQDGK